MHEHLDALEARMQRLQQSMQQARLQHDSAQVRLLGEELQRTLNAYNALFNTGDASSNQATPQSPPRSAAAPEPKESGLTAREQIHQVLTLVTVPAPPKLISQVHEAFFSGPLNTARLATVRRDEERSFRASPYARAYYVCSALTFDLLAPARALLALSTWPVEQRVIGPLTQRVNFLTTALRLAEAAQRRAGDDPLPESIRRLLQHYHRNIPGCPAQGPLDLKALSRAAAVELEIHASDDADTRTESARRASQLNDAQRLFGATLRDTNRLRHTS